MNTRKPAWADVALKDLPDCCLSAYENLLSDSQRPNNLKDMMDAVNHEMALHQEGQDGCISDLNYKKCIAFKKKWTLPAYWPLGNNLWWCRTHERRATHLLVRENQSDEVHCDPKLGGITFPCRCYIKLKGSNG